MQKHVVKVNHGLFHLEHCRMGSECHKKSEQRDSQEPVSQTQYLDFTVKAKEVMRILYQGTGTVKFILESYLSFRRS